MNEFWATYGTTVELGLASSVLAWSTYIALAAGVFSFATATFAAVGGFLAADMIGDRTGDTLLAVCVAAVAGLLIALVLSVPLVRLASHWLALATVAIVLVTRVAVLNLGSVTGGVNGMPVAGPPSAGVCAGVFLAAGFALWLWSRSRMGLMSAAVRSDAAVAAGFGINVTRVQRAAFGMSGLLGGVGGALYASCLQYIAPDTFFVDLSFLTVAATILGGAFFWLGPALGAGIFTALPVFGETFFNEYGDVARGALVVLLILFLPRGLLTPGLVHRVSRLLRGRGTPPTGQTRSTDVAGVTGPGVGMARRARPPEAPGVPGAEPGTGEPADGQSLLEVDGLTKSFGGVQAVRDVTFSVRRGSITAIVGPNGAGKTTVLNLITGFASADSGTLRMAGRDFSNRPSHVIARLGIRRTFQNIRMLHGTTVWQEIILGLHTEWTTSLAADYLHTSRSVSEGRQLHLRAAEVMSRLGISRYADQTATTLPYGQQRLVEVARAVVSGPRLLLLDEPSAGMNGTEAAELGAALVALRRAGLTIVLIEHNMPFVRQHCDEVLVMNEGEVLMAGTPEQCLADVEVRRIYLGQLDNA